MAIKGNLQEMDLPNLLQVVAQSDDVVCIELEQGDKRADLYLSGRNLCHAVMMQKNGTPLSSQPAEEIFYTVLRWNNGNFTVKRNVPLNEQTVDVSWEFLLMEGLRRIDEGGANPSESEANESLSDMLSDVSDEDAAALREMMAQQENNNMADINTTLNEIMQIDGAIAAAIVDWQSGLTLGTIGSGIDIDLAAAGNTERGTRQIWGDERSEIGGTIEDILITLTDQYHLIRMMGDNQGLFIYLALRRGSANLGLARHRLTALEKDLKI